LVNFIRDLTVVKSLSLVLSYHVLITCPKKEYSATAL
jgi:hypothetical protein